MRALVTGANGFVGLHLVAHLKDCGDEVVESSTQILDRQALIAAFADASPEVVYHLAAQADVAASWNRSAETWRTNTEGTLNVCDAARLAGAKRLLGISSADVYGIPASKGPLNETTQIRPISPYAASKAAAEIIHGQAMRGHKFEVVVARSFNHLGPGQSPRFVASAIAKRIADNEREGETNVAVGNLKARRDFCDVRDVVRAYRGLMQHGQSGETYHVCSGKDHSISYLAHQLIDAAKHQMHFVEDPNLLRPLDIDVLVGDNTKLRNTVDWQPQIPLTNTLEDLLTYWRNETTTSKQ